MTVTTPPGIDRLIKEVNNVFIPLTNRADMVIVKGLTLIEPAARTSTALAWRSRTQADAFRFSHAASVAERMPHLFDTVLHNSRFAVEHLDVIWSCIHRQLATVPHRLVDEVAAALDRAVEPAVLDWLGTVPGPVNLADLRTLVDSVIIDNAPGLSAETAQAERDSARLTRRGLTYTLQCGDEIMAATIDKALTDRAGKELAGLRRQQVEAGESDGPGAAGEGGLPTLSELKARILLDLLGDNPETVQVRVNLFRATVDGIHGLGAGYCPGIGWVDVATAQRLESVATTIREIPTDPADLPVTDSYRFPVLHELAMEARDGHCRFPGCTVSAARCENDHIVNSPHTDPDSNGTTSVDNGMKLCGPHHREKSEGHWRCETPDGGHTVHWTGPGGEKFTTYAAGPISNFADRYYFGRHRQ
ncbi:HNH endonuclease signature motif containing protein [Corynebacterium terpenotabidum]|uniref:DUF222 domain-containing protein n=1 Tax=Corynebacterium terpenotabidum Y-11 TaxID=1200352 RepID=S4XD67_9CORY|nr:HNH endonuclease signature motif containing protein [Corynebacterium terpenotabidum]AGP30449.1 hypothetical protein A606_04000 [Corynebacterium terpenotabidum Y-11]